MRLNPVLLLLAAFSLTGVAYAQSAQAPGPVPPQSQDPATQDNAHPGARCDVVRDDYMAPITFTQKTILNQNLLRRQAEDQAHALILMTEKEVTSPRCHLRLQT